MWIWEAIGVSAAIFTCACILARQCINGDFDRPLDDDKDWNVRR